MQDLPRRPVQSAQNRAGRVPCHVTMAFHAGPLPYPSLRLQGHPTVHCFHVSNEKGQPSHFSAPIPLGMCMRGNSCLLKAALIEHSIAPC